MFGKTRHIHFVGIGGAGMSGIAEILINHGFIVSGSDIHATEVTSRLESLGAEISIGHSESNVKDADVVVVSSAVPSSNIEIITAQRKKIPVIPRVEMLAELTRMKYSIAVAGAHGKTTTTAMISSVLEYGGLDPTVVDGGKVRSLGANVRQGNSEFMVVEADEAYGSIKKLSSTIAVVTNIDNDHLDYYETMDALKNTFLDFINKVPFYGVAILCLDDENIQELIPKLEKRFLTYGTEPQANFTATGICVNGTGSSYKVYHDGKYLGDMQIKLPGVHNVVNSLAAIAVGSELSVPFENIQKALKDFTGVQHRFEILGEINDIIVIDDYGHHPTEIKATLKAARDTYDDKRIIAIFQPHRYSRSKLLADDFARCFYQADMLIMTEIYSAMEEPIEGVSGEMLVNVTREYGHKNVVYIPNKNDIADYVMKITKPGDLIITLGAGDIWKTGKEIVEKLANITKNK
ncbi:MAG: UDP-N-acetylmuramate--L-alanine ligase [bacterium]